MLHTDETLDAVGTRSAPGDVDDREAPVSDDAGGREALVPDETQCWVLRLDRARHASVLGAPGSGKTSMLVESFARIAAEPDWRDDDLLVLAPNRLVAGRLRTALQRRLGRAVGGTPVRTAVSLAFAVLARHAAAEGREAPRLLTGTAQDEIVSEVVAELLDAEPPGADRLEAEQLIGSDQTEIDRREADQPGAVVGDLGRERFAPELMRSAPFRAELRELARVLDDAALAPEELDAMLREAAGHRSRSAFTALPSAEALEQWRAALELLGVIERRIRADRPGELTSSRLLRAAAETLNRDTASAVGASVPSLILIDDAHELTEGELALVAACAAAGSRIWAFGDPDIATSAFRGERVNLLTRMEAELARRGAAPDPGAAPVQSVVLDQVHRQTPELRALVRGLTERIGAAGAGAQRAADSARAARGGSGSEPLGRAVSDAVQFVTVPAVSEQLGVIAHRLRRRRLGLDGLPELAWSEMAVVCRTREEASSAARTLAGLGVETAVTSGGIVLREQRIVRELTRLLQHALGIAPLTPADVLDMLGGEIGGLDPISLRRFRGSLRLREQRAARSEEREPRPLDDIVAEAFADPGEQPIIDSAGGRALRRVAKLAAAGARVRDAEGTPRETLWALWDGTGLARRWQQEALDGRGIRSDEAHRALDAVLGLFFVLQRHEEQDSDVPVAEVLEELLTSSVPEDSLAARSARDVVTVTTPQGLIGVEFSLVAVLGPQDGVWPNLRSRGSLLGVTALERWLRGGVAESPDRRDTLHDELRLFAHACARPKDELLVVAVADEDHHPSTFFGIAHPRHDGALPSARLTLRGAVAEMRRRLTRDPDDVEALASLAAMAREGVPGARPDEWYGVLQPSTESPLIDLAADPEQTVPVSPSQLEKSERCPLDWAVDRLGGGTTNFSSQLGTLLHRAFEQVDDPDPERLFAVIESEWDSLEFDAEWESERSLQLARTMTEGLAAYLEDFADSSRELVGRELEFRARIDRAELRGTADRLERVHGSDGRAELLVIDLKTGKTAPGGTALAEHAQLQAYQFGVLHGAFSEKTDDGAVDDGVAGDGAAAEGTTGEPASGGTGNAGAALVYVHPDALRSSDSGYSLRSQQPLDDETRAAVSERIADAARVMAGGRFTARVEHHCSDPHSPGGSCRLHIIPAVSHA